MEKPIRVQRKRTKGFKLPLNTKCVNRGTIWGNPFKVVKRGLVWVIEVEHPILREIQFLNTLSTYGDKLDAINDCLICYKEYLKIIDKNHSIKLLLNGLNLACFCSLDSPCHADVLLEIANG